MLFREMIPVYSENNNKHIINSGKAGNIFNVKAGDTY
jgi:hypothetical protein